MRERKRERDNEKFLSLGSVWGQEKKEWFFKKVENLNQRSISCCYCSD